MWVSFCIKLFNCTCISLKVVISDQTLLHCTNSQIGQVWKKQFIFHVKKKFLIFLLFNVSRRKQLCIDKQYKAGELTYITYITPLISYKINCNVQGGTKKFLTQTPSQNLTNIQIKKKKKRLIQELFSTSLILKAFC